jgi:hypothetical protein
MKKNEPIKSHAAVSVKEQKANLNQNPAECEITVEKCGPLFC